MPSCDCTLTYHKCMPHASILSEEALTSSALFSLRKPMPVHCACESGILFKCIPMRLPRSLDLGENSVFLCIFWQHLVKVTTTSFLKYFFTWIPDTTACSFHFFLTRTRKKEPSFLSLFWLPFFLYCYILEYMRACLSNISLILNHFPRYLILFQWLRFIRNAGDSIYLS